MRQFFVILFLTIVTILISCKKEIAQNENQPPIADAGPDQTFYWPTGTIYLEGSGTDPDGYITSYRWVKISGPTNLPGGIENALHAKATVRSEPGIHQYVLTVNDNKGAAATDTVNITVIDTIVATGKEYIFHDMKWDYDGDDYTASGGTGVWNSIIVSRSDLFYDHTKKMEVSIKVGNSTLWVSLANLPRPSTTVFVNNLLPGFGYSLSHSGSLYVYNVFQTPANDLYGTKASIKVKYL